MSLSEVSEQMPASQKRFKAIVTWMDAVAESMGTGKAQLDTMGREYLRFEFAGFGEFEIGPGKRFRKQIFHV